MNVHNDGRLRENDASVVAVLRVRPSEATREILAPLYRPGVAREALGGAALHAVLRMPVRQGAATSEQVLHLQQQYVRPLAAEPLPLVGAASVRRQPEVGVQVSLFAALPEALRGRFSHLPKMEQGILEAQLAIPPEHAVQNDIAHKAGVRALQSVLGMRHPASARLPLHRRTVDPERYHLTTLPLSEIFID